MHHVKAITYPRSSHFLCMHIPMSILMTHNSIITLSVMIFIIFLHPFSYVYSLSPLGSIERTTKQQILASVLPDSVSSQLFLASPSKKYDVFLIRQEISSTSEGLENDFCFIQIQNSSHSIWESECAPIGKDNICTLVFSDLGLQIYDGTRFVWSTDVEVAKTQTLDLVDGGDMQMKGQDGQLVWKASDHPTVNKNCGSIGSHGVAAAHTPFGSSISDEKPPFEETEEGYQQQQQLGNQGQTLPQPFSSFTQPFSSLNDLPFGASNQQGFGLGHNSAPFDNGVSMSKSSMLGALLISLVALMADFPFIV